MEEINLKELYYYFIKRLYILIIITILTSGIGFTYSKFIKVPLYNGETTLILVKSEENKETNDLQSEIQVNQKLVKTYSKVITSRRVLDQVIKELDLDMSYSELQSSITVSNEQDTEILKISVSNKDNKLARDIANKTAEVFEKEIVNIYKIENVSIIDKAIVNKTPYNIHLVKEMVIYALVGIVLSSGIIFVIFYFDTTIKSTEDIEKLGLVVLGAIPKEGSAK